MTSRMTKEVMEGVSNDELHRLFLIAVKTALSSEEMQKQFVENEELQVAMFTVFACGYGACEYKHNEDLDDNAKEDGGNNQ